MKVVSLFSGAGGLDLGFIWAGHKIVWANDNFEDAVSTYRANIGNHIISKDIEKIRSSDIPDCDIVIGGFPCQGFSVANWNRKTGDSRNKLYRQMLRVVRAKKPKYFVAENVKGLKSMERGRVLDLILEDFRKAGYEVEYAVLNAADYGVPQMRQRIIIVGTRKDIQPKIVLPPPKTHVDPNTKETSGLKPWVTVGQALMGIPEPEDAPNIPNHTASKYKLRFNNYLGHRHVDPDRPAPTVTARGDERGGVVVIHHPSNQRRMTARELATVQSFPSDFVFSASRSSAYRQIANAVPPLLGMAVASLFPKKTGSKRVNNRP